MKTAVLEFQRNRVKRQQSGAASVDILKTIVELRSALQSIGKAILAVERLVVAQANEHQSKQRTKAKRKGRVIALRYAAGVNDQPAVPESAGAQT
jgi:hypothetical protein